MSRSPPQRVFNAQGARQPPSRLQSSRQSLPQEFIFCTRCPLWTLDSEGQGCGSVSFSSCGAGRPNARTCGPSFALVDAGVETNGRAANSKEHVASCSPLTIGFTSTGAAYVYSRRFRL